MTRRIQKTRKVAVLVESTRTYARGLISGIARFARRQRNWSLYFTPRGLEDPPPHWLKDWDGDGILARIDNQVMLNAIRQCGVPAVDFRRVVDVGDIPVIGPDDRLIAQSVFDHFRVRGFQSFAYYGMADRASKAMRCRAASFAEACQEANMPYFRFPSRSRRLHHTAKSWEREHESLALWLRKLPKPVGVMACTDDYGVRLLEAARRAEIAVPDEVAVVAAGNDECLCQLATPSLSSVALNAEQIGFEGAKLLHTMMSRRARARKDIQIEPAGVVTRVSSDILAVTDPRVARALRFIRENACNDIRVTDVMRHVHMSRTGLNTLMRKSIDRSVHEEIRKARLERVREMLLTTDAPLKEIAFRSGFRYTEYLVRAFRKATGKTPREFRKQAGVGGVLPES